MVLDELARVKRHGGVAANRPETCTWHQEPGGGNKVATDQFATHVCKNILEMPKYCPSLTFQVKNEPRVRNRKILGLKMAKNGKNTKK